MRALNKPQAVALAVILFMALHLLLTLITNNLATNANNFQTLLPWLNLIAYLLYLLSGFTASIIVNKQFVLIGISTGLLSALSAVIIFGVGGEVFGIASTLVLGSIFGGIGGGLSHYIKRDATNAL